MRSLRKSLIAWGRITAPWTSRRIQARSSSKRTSRSLQRSTVMRWPAAASSRWRAISASPRRTPAFGLPEAKRGRGANFATVMLQYLIPRGIAMQMLFTGEPITAQEALRFGLVNQVVPLPELLPAATALAEKIAKNAPVSLRRIKELSVKSIGSPLFFALKMAPGPSPYESQDAREGAAAFTEKRSASWKDD